MSQKQLADRIFINPSTVNRWFKEGSMPQPRTIEAIANAVGVRKEWLLSGEGPEGQLTASLKRSMVQNLPDGVKETDPGYGLVKKILVIAEQGTTEQKALVNSFLDSVCEQLGITKIKPQETVKK